MSLVRVNAPRGHAKTLTNADKVAWVQKKNGTGSIAQPEDPSQVSVFVLPDITGLEFGVDTVAQEILKQSKEDNSCDLFVTSTPLPATKEGIKKLPFASNAAYINCCGRIYYVNKCKSACIPIKKMTDQTIAQFNEAMKVAKLADNEYRTLTAGELKTIKIITGHEHDNRRPVYMYNDNDILTGMYQIGLPIENEADTIAKVMEEKHPNGPFIIVAYSYSGLLAIELMQIFTKKNLDAFVYIIDSPAPELSKALLTSQSETYVQSLLDIVNYTAKICFRNLTISLTPDQVENFRYLSPTDCMNQLAQLVAEDKFYPLGNQKAFAALIKFETLRLEKMAHYEKEITKPLPGPSKAKIVLTNETVKKYQNAPFGGWEGYATYLDYIQCKETNLVSSKGKVIRTVVPQEPGEELLLTSATHQSIVQNENAAILGRDINSFIENNITRRYLHQYNITQDTNKIWQRAQELAEDDPVLADVANKLKECVDKRYSPTDTPQLNSPNLNHATSTSPRIDSTTLMLDVLKPENLPSNRCSPEHSPVKGATTIPSLTNSSSDSSLYRKPKIGKQEPSLRETQKYPSYRTP